MRAGFVFILGAWIAAWSAEAALVNRWSFTGAAGAVSNGTPYLDSLTGAPAYVVGTGAVASATAITLPGGAGGNFAATNITAYIDLPNGLASSKTNLTVEIWASVQSYRQFERLIELGRVNTAGDGAAGEITRFASNAPGATSASDGITLTLARSAANNVSQQRFETKLDGVTVVDGTGYYRIADTSVATATNTEYHYVLTFEDGVGAFATNGGRVSWYRNGTNAATLECGFRLSQLEDVNNWLGRSLWSADQMANATFNEVRIYNHAFSPQAIAASYQAGPNPSPAASAVNDAVTMHHGQKVRLNVLANDAGTLDPGSVVVMTPPQFGRATPDTRGRILYTHTNGTPASDSFVYGASPFGTNAPATATVTVTFATSLRISNPNLNVPSTPPPEGATLPATFGGTAFSQPLCLASPPGDTQRVFVVQKGGLIRVVTNLATGAGGAATFLNLPPILTARGEAISTQSEQGLLGLAFHPNYASNRHFFIFYSVAGAGFTNERVARFTTQAGNPNAADTNSEVILINQFDNFGNHNGGDLQFGADGYLYVSLGDEGDQNDTGNNSQTITKDFFSGILRIDVDKKPGSLAPNHHPAIVAPTNYAIPPDNPWVGVTNFNGTNFAASVVRTEFWAIGLRNPWRMAFDPDTGDLWCGDVGGGAREEVDIITRGGNFGWAYREGHIAGPKSGGTPANFTNLYHSAPMFDYAHGSGTNQGNSITGGRVYRGSRFSSISNKYFFADYVSGNIWALTRTGTNAGTVARIAGEGSIVGFGVDPSNGDILLADIDGVVRRLEMVTPAGAYPTTLDETGLFADLTDLSPAPGVTPYNVNLPFWSDNAIKSRWFTMPVATNTAGWKPEGTWSNTPGMIWVKHFDFDLVATNPASRARVETRVLVRNTNGVYGISYRWNTNGTDATLVADEGSNFTVNVVNGAVTNQQLWRIPSRAECLSCHNGPAGFALSFGTRQLNLTNSILGFSGNQIDLLRDGGCLSGVTTSPHLMPRHLRPDETAYPLEARVRSYLEVNCAYCHQAGGTTPTAFDVRALLTLDQTGLINGNAANNGGNPTNKLIVPGDTLHSIVLNRIGATNGFTRMPPIGSNLIDSNSVALLTDWIMNILPARQTYNDWRLVQFGSTNSPAGDPVFDFDGDGANNRLEYLAGTLPGSSNSVPWLGLSVTGTQAAILFNVPGNRSVQVETSTNLESWLLWNVPGNAGLPVLGGPGEIGGPATNLNQFHRLRLWEN